MTGASTLPPRVLYALASAADVSLETIKRRLQGRPLRPSTAARIEAAAARLKVELPAPVAAAASWGGQRPGPTPPPSAR